MKHKLTVKTTTVVFLTTLSCIFTACKKDSTTPQPLYQEENPLNAFLSTTGLNQIAGSFANTTAFEMGFGFKPKVKGIIKGITVKLPYVNSSLKVTISDLQA